MKKYKILTVVLAAALVLALGAVGVLASGVYGTQSDPLVTVSYLNDVFTPALRTELENQANAITEQFEGELSAQLSASTGGYALVTLQPGQTLQAQPGCEVLLRAGTLTVSAAGLSDCTAGTAAAAGAALTTNHLYLAGSAVTLTAGAAAVTVMARGIYTVR